MNFGLLVSQLPHVQESRVHYDAMLALQTREPHRFVAFWQRLKTLIAWFSALIRHTQEGHVQISAVDRLRVPDTS